eukprot:8925427-Pyramimonas_sp.AAC.1
MIEIGGLSIKVTLTTDAEYVFKSLSSIDLKNPTECSWVRQMMDRGSAHSAQWCDARDMTAYCHAEGSIDRDVLLKFMGEALLSGMI